MKALDDNDHKVILNYYLYGFRYSYLNNKFNFLIKRQTHNFGVLYFNGSFRVYSSKGDYVEKIDKIDNIDPFMYIDKYVIPYRKSGGCVKYNEWVYYLAAYSLSIVIKSNITKMPKKFSLKKWDGIGSNL